MDIEGVFFCLTDVICHCWLGFSEEMEGLWARGGMYIPGLVFVSYCQHAVNDRLLTEILAAEINCSFYRFRVRVRLIYRCRGRKTGFRSSSPRVSYRRGMIEETGPFPSAHIVPRLNTSDAEIFIVVRI